MITSTYFFSHHKCLLPSDYKRLKLDKFWKLLATGFDKNGMEFVSVIEVFSIHSTIQS